MSKPARLLLLAAPLLPLALSAAQAQAPAAPALPSAPPLTEEQSASLDRALRLWTETFASAAALSAGTHTVTPEGDHYRVREPLGLGLSAAGKAAVQGGALVAEARPLDAGRWQFTQVRNEWPVITTMPSATAGTVSKVVLGAIDQDGQATIDPSLATPSTFDGKASAIIATIDVPSRLSGTLHTGPIATHAVWTPAGPGRIDQKGSITGRDIAIDIAGKQKVGITLGGFDSAMTMSDLSPGRLVALRDRLDQAQKMASPEARPAAAGLTDAQRKLLHGLLADLRDVATAASGRLTLDDLTVTAAGHVARLRRAELSDSLAAPGGKGEAKLRLALEGPTASDIPPAIASLLPHRLVLAPRVSGIPVDGLANLLGVLIDQATPPDKQELQARFAALAAQGPVTVGLDELAFDVGPALLTAAGALHLGGADPQSITGDAVIEAKGLGALIQRAHTDPLLRQAAPVLIFLKGIGEEDDSGNVTWKVTYAQGHALVNGTDLSQLMPLK